VIDYDVARWLIGVYLRTLKPGCKVEESQLEAMHREKNRQTFYKIIAWRAFQKTQQKLVDK